jgi:hypothetical protein
MLVVIGLLVGALNFQATRSFRRRAGVSPWRIHPVIWAATSIIISFAGTVVITVLAAIAMRTTRVSGGWGQFSGRVPAFQYRSSAGVGEPVYPAPAEVAAEVDRSDSASPPYWHPDPSGVYQYRYWDGRQWTEYVSIDGVTVIDLPRS